ncbi:hypothetical protein PCC6912_19430 [Chlorogloeopsis fritschii PCC 6912]|uniref:ABC transporter domain-containing protein n=1 Tax=Chlorogloeopsis fritschii PCC 6912 TaxID=211165 RepID=A0A3S0Y3R1_CHLFR|nr:hypothetical protein PCC6912_19430 [Chlorogloeopsis fritschii PCC 6912]
MYQQAVVKVCHLNHYFGQDELKKQVLFDINLEIYAGEIVIMMGPSGSGRGESSEAVTSRHTMAETFIKQELQKNFF